jgi:hypothetical protein
MGRQAHRHDRHLVTAISVDGPQQGSNLRWTSYGGKVLHLGRSDRAAQVGSDVLVAPHGRDAIAKDAAQYAPHPPGALIGSGGLDLSEDGERLVRCDLRDGDAADYGVSLGKEPSDLLDCHFREAVPLAFDEPFLCHSLEGVGCGILCSDAGALLLQRGIDPVCHELLGLVPPDAGIREAYGWPPPR